MPVLFDRAFALKINGTEVVNLGTSNARVENILRVSFNIERTLEKNPSKAQVSIYNLRETNRSEFQTKGQFVEIEAGYKDNISQIFAGDIDFLSSSLNGRDWITSIQGGDGSKRFKETKLKTSIRGPASIGNVLNTCARALGYKTGNLKEVIARGPVGKGVRFFSKGVTLKGKAESLMDKYVKSFGYTWSIQDGAYQLLAPKETIGNKIIIINQGSGLIGGPEPGENGYINFVSLLQPELLPARRIRMQSFNDRVNGEFRIEKVKFKGNTWGDDWYAEVEASPL